MRTPKIGEKKVLTTTFGKVKVSKRHGWAAPTDGFAISPLLQSHYLRFEAELVPATAAGLLNEVLGQKLTNLSQGRRLLEHYGRDEAVIAALTVPLSKSEQQPVLRAVATKGEAAQEVIYVMFDGVMLPYDDGYYETKVGRVFLGSHLENVSHSAAEAINHRRRVVNSEYVAVEGHYTQFTAQFTPLVRAVQRREAADVPTVVITDGALWMADYVRDEFPDAIHILDFFHAFEHLAEFAVVVWPGNKERQPILERWKRELRSGKVDSILGEVQNYTDHARTKVATAATALVTYLVNNQDRMAYDDYRAKGYLIGSGAIESAARSVVQQRCKLAGQRWGDQGAGAGAVLSLRSLYQSGKQHRMDKIILSQYRNVA